MNNYELSYNERKAEEQLQFFRDRGMKMFLPRSVGHIKNNRKQTNGRRIQVINLKNGGAKQIRKPSLS